MKSINNKDIAIIGMATNFPRSKNLKEYWNVLKNGVDCIREFPKNRKKDIEDYINFLTLHQKKLYLCLQYKECFLK